MPRSLEEIIAHADEYADAFEAYDPQPGDEGTAAAGPLNPHRHLAQGFGRGAAAERIS